MTWLDAGALAVIVLSGLAGFRRGLVVGVLSLGGLLGGAVLGARVAPTVIGQADSRYVPLIALGGAVVGSFLAQALFAFAGRRIRTLLLVVPPLKALDHVAGFFLGALTGLALCWTIGAVMLYLPGQTGLREKAQASKVLRTVNDVIPPSRVMEALSRSDPFAIISGPEANVPPPDPAVLEAAGVKRARASVVRIRGNACGFGVEGSGWIAGPGLVVTNAHVVAGIDRLFVDRGDGTERVDGVTVAFDPTNDIAIVRAPGIGREALGLATTADGVAGAILGYPGNGPYTVRAARTGKDVTFLGRDAYGNFPFTRTSTLIRGVVEAGNSGGPVVDVGARQRVRRPEQRGARCHRERGHHAHRVGLHRLTDTAGRAGQAGVRRRAPGSSRADGTAGSRRRRRRARAPRPSAAAPARAPGRGRPRPRPAGPSAPGPARRCRAPRCAGAGPCGSS
jgi:uncharacterized membrane protein required for colicin V production